MATPSAPTEPASSRSDRVAGWVLLGGFALLIPAVATYVTGQEEPKAWLLGAGLLVTLFGLIAFEEALRERGERLLPRFGSVAFAIGLTCFILHDAIHLGGGPWVSGLERAYTVLTCVAISLYGWSILRSKALPRAVGWFAIAWAIVDGYLYVARIFQPPLGPNLATLVFGAALVWPRRRDDVGADKPVG
jgi:hypothetical protein